MKFLNPRFKATAILFACMFISLAASTNTKSITVDGFCYLEGASDHSGTKVLFTAESPSAVSDSVYTNADGSYFAGLSEGIYIVHFSHMGWQPHTLQGEFFFFEDTTLDNVSLFPGLVVDVSGPQSGIWASGNLYQVLGDISVANGDTLIIEPGVTVKFMDHYSLNISGTLLAVGNEVDSIFFTSGQPIQNPDSWAHILFMDNSGNSSVVSYAKIEYSNSGIYCINSSPTISDNTFNNNTQGIYCTGSSPTISNNVISSNSNLGIWCDEYSSPMINNNVIINNDDGYYQSAAIVCEDGSSPTISNNILNDNSGSGVACFGSSALIFNNIIDNNNYDGIRCKNYSNSTIYNNTISNNNGAGIYIGFSSPTIYNNTISNNDYGIYCFESTSTYILNNIFFENSIGIRTESTPTALTYNLFWENSTTAMGNGLPAAFGDIVAVNSNGDPCDTYLNLFMDPLFVDPVNLDFHLTENSPCIDAGDPDPEYHDPDGTIADIGAYYYAQMPPPVIVDFLGEPTEGVANLLVQFSSEVTGQVNTYSWDFGDGGTSSLMNPSHTYTKVGSFRLRLTVTGPGGTTSLTKQEYITVFDPQLVPQPDFSAEPVSGYVPLEVGFTNLTMGEFESLLWDFGDGSTSTQTNPTHEYQSIGLYSVSLTAYNSHGYDTETKFDYIEVQESEEVTAAFEVSGSYGCSPFTVNFTNQSTGSINSYLWDFGDGETSTEENPEHIFIGADEYTVLLTVTGQVNTDTAEETIIVELAEPFITAIEDRPNDQGGYVYLNFTKSFYDNVVPQDGVKSTEGYSFQRLDNENWVALTYVYATGEENYTVELTTLVDSTATSNGMTSFRVIAGMDEGTWISEQAMGYSIDNIAPSIPQDFEGVYSDNLIQFQWQSCPDEDFQYFAIYKTDEAGQFEEEPFATTISNEAIDIFGTSDCSYKVSAIDFCGNQSLDSEVLTAQSVQMNAGWSSLSAYVGPSFPEVEDIFNNIESELIILQNLSGAYWPLENLNTLGEWDNNSGYFVKAVSDVNLPIIGKKVDTNSLALNAGWNLIPVLSECPVNITEIFASLDVVIIKEIAGTNLYWPEAGVSTLETMEAGKAYFVLMNNTGTIYFPDCIGE